MLGRACPGQPAVKFETGRQLTRRFESVQQAREEFWGRWIREVFTGLLKQSKWTKDKRDVKVGDIVLRKDETAAGQTYKYARVIKVHIGTDGKVRAADIEYKVPGETRYCTTTRPIHKMVLVIPVEEQRAENGKVETEAVRPEKRSPDKGSGNEAQEAETNKAPQARGATKANLPDTEETKGKPNRKVRYKKIQPRKKASRQTRAIVVTIPTESEEIKDVGAIAKRKRGRPKKPKKENFLDPHKGSVPNYGEEVCADPGKGDATLGVGGPGPPVRDSEGQLVPDRGGGKT
jgi:hypothetical protein